MALLEENDFSPDIVYYLDTPPSIEEIKQLASTLKLDIRQLLRKNEAEYEQFGLGDETLNEGIVLDIVSKHPILIERPILLYGSQAVIGRPPEAVLELAQKSVAE